MFKNTVEFANGLETLGKSKADCDMQAQRLAEYSINQSIEHNNADCGLRLIKRMQEIKYGNLKAMAKYLVTYGQFAVDEKNQKMVFAKSEAKVIPEQPTPVWIQFGKVESIEHPRTDAYIIEQVTKLLKSATTWAKDHPKNCATNQTLNALRSIVTPETKAKPVRKNKAVTNDDVVVVAAA